MKLKTTVLAALSLALAANVAFAQTRPLQPLGNALHPHDPLMDSPAGGTSLPAPGISPPPTQPNDMQPRPLPGTYAPDRPSDMQPRPLPGTTAPLVNDPATSVEPRGTR